MSHEFRIQAKSNFLCSILIALACAYFVPPVRALQSQSRGSVILNPCLISGTNYEMLCGSYDVFENRTTQSGRKITLNIAMLPSKSQQAKADPIFYLAGGPGGSAVNSARGFYDSLLRTDREIVMIDQRGTGQSNPLQCRLGGSSEDLQGYLDGDFARVGPVRKCKRQLKKVANLKQYTTPMAVDDIDEVRAAMGYTQINLLGNSWGSRTGLVYLRRHPESVRTAVLKSLVPLAITYPAYHAQGAQEAVDLIFQKCGRNDRCAAAYPNVEQEFAEVLGALNTKPVVVMVSHPDTGSPVEVTLTRNAFSEGIRWLMFASPESLPAMVHRAFEDDYAPITQFTVDYAHFLGGLKMGLLLSEVCSTDVPRIDRAQIPDLTEDTFMGDTRVRDTIKVCKRWPKGNIPSSYGDPVVSDRPILIWTGKYDSASRPGWVKEATAYLSKSKNIVVNEAHTPGGDCIDKITSQFFNKASVKGLNTKCAKKIKLPPFWVPE